MGENILMETGADEMTIASGLIRRRWGSAHKCARSRFGGVGCVCVCVWRCPLFGNAWEWRTSCCKASTVPLAPCVSLSLLLCRFSKVGCRAARDKPRQSAGGGSVRRRGDVGEWGYGGGPCVFGREKAQTAQRTDRFALLVGRWESPGETVSWRCHCRSRRWASEDRRAGRRVKGFSGQEILNRGEEVFSLLFFSCL